MTSMTALEAKNAFGQFLEAAQRAPVTVTKNGREVGAMFSKADLEAMADVYLWPPLLEAVRLGEVSVSEALLRQVTLNRRLARAEADVAAGRVQEMDEAYFERLRVRVHEAAVQHRE